MSTHVLDAPVREVLGKKVKHLRKQGLIPATVYGKGFDAVSVQVDDRGFHAVYRKSGKTALIELAIPGHGMQSVFVQDVQRHPVTRNILHIDFKVVDLKKLVQIEVPIVTVGESPIVARGDAILIHVVNTVMVEALPAELPQHIEVDASALDEMEKSIHVSDLPPVKGYKILAEPTDVLLSLSQVRAATAEGPVEEVPVEPELIRKPRAGDEE